MDEWKTISRRLQPALSTRPKACVWPVAGRGGALNESVRKDISIYNGRYNCQIACKDEHCSNDWMPIAAPQPETGHFWMKVNEHIRGSVPKVKMHYVPVLCQHCDARPA